MSQQFNDSANKSGLVQACESTLFGDNGFGRISDDTNLLADFTRRLNEGLNIVASAIMQADGRWQWDDNNNTDFPIGTTNLVANQQDYTFEVTHLKINRVEVKDESGNWTLLTPIDARDVEVALAEFEATAGVPQYYDKIANSVFLYPVSSYSQAASLKVYFQRPPSYFTSSDTTKVPGFNSLFHNLVALIACREYALDRQMPVAKSLAERVQIGLQDISDAYTLRNKDEVIGVRAKRINAR
jgi:hypothetical protein